MSQGSARRAGDDGFPNPPQGNPNFSQRNPSRAQQNPNSNPWISFAESSLIKELRRPPGLLGRFRPQRRHRRWPRLFASGCLSLLLSSFLILQFHEASEGLAPFRSRILVFVRRLDAISARVRRPRALRAGTEGTVASTEQSPGREPGDRGRAEKTGQLIRCPARMRPLKGPIRLEPWLADGRQPFMPQEYLTIPAFESFPSVSPVRGESGPPTVGRVQARLDPAIERT
jgi:hypothetical protein